MKKNKLELKKPLVLIGMMGSGKTHLGRLLAKRLGLDFYDSDVVIEQKAGCSVSEIFEQNYGR
jgi:shikimate kinase